MSTSTISTMDTHKVILMFYASSRIACLKELIDTQDEVRRTILRKKIRNLFEEERKALALLKKSPLN